MNIRVFTNETSGNIFNSDENEGSFGLDETDALFPPRFTEI